jgi:hypothetical protein
VRREVDVLHLFRQQSIRIGDTPTKSGAVRKLRVLSNLTVTRLVKNWQLKFQ